MTKTVHQCETAQSASQEGSRLPTAAGENGMAQKMLKMTKRTGEVIENKGSSPVCFAKGRGNAMKPEEPMPFSLKKVACQVINLKVVFHNPIKQASLAGSNRFSRLQKIIQRQLWNGGQAVFIAMKHLSGQNWQPHNLDRNVYADDSEVCMASYSSAGKALEVQLAKVGDIPHRTICDQSHCPGPLKNCRHDFTTVCAVFRPGTNFLEDDDCGFRGFSNSPEQLDKFGLALFVGLRDRFDMRRNGYATPPSQLRKLAANLRGSETFVLGTEF